jgi:ABC-type polysaccharide/polyol phosphate transport system ATPase subunit
MGTYSSGMRIRLRFGIIYALQPNFIMIDEALSVSDAAFQDKCITYLKEYAKEKAVLLISHDMKLIETLCNRFLLLKSGSIILDTKKFTTAYDTYIQQ